MMDHALILYGLIFLVSVYGLSLFSWWWICSNHASEMFIYVTLLFGAIALLECFNIVARVSRCVDLDAYVDFMGSWIWTFRLYPVLFVLLAIVVRMTLRLKSWKWVKGGSKP